MQMTGRFPHAKGTHKLQYKHTLLILAAYDELSKAAPYERQGTTLEIQKFSIADNHTCVENTHVVPHKAVEEVPKQETFRRDWLL